MENHTITIADLDALRGIIDLACQRGAFRASEAQQVGELYNKLSGFLEALVSQAQAEESSDANNPAQGE